MKIGKIKYNIKKEITREKLANPFSNNTIHCRLKRAGAVELKNNCKWIKENNGYSKVIIINKSKKL